jgi:hypothetical protein
VKGGNFPQARLYERMISAGDSAKAMKAVSRNTSRLSNLTEHKEQVEGVKVKARDYSSIM